MPTWSEHPHLIRQETLLVLFPSRESPRAKPHSHFPLFPSVNSRGVSIENAACVLIVFQRLANTRLKNIRTRVNRMAPCAPDKKIPPNPRESLRQKIIRPPIWVYA